MAERQLVAFRLGKEEYAVPIAQVREILRNKKTTTLPNMPAGMQGVINLRGEVVSVFDLAMKFGLKKDADDDNTRVIIVETSIANVGVVVDEVTQVISLNDSAIEPAPNMAGGSCINGIGKAGDRLIIILDVNTLFREDDIKLSTDELCGAEKTA